MIKNLFNSLLMGTAFTLFSPNTFASSLNIHATNSSYGYTAVLVFILAYVLVILEEKTHFRKSKPVVISAGIIWVLIALLCKSMGLSEAAEHAVKSTLLEFSVLLLFLLVAMTYVNAMEERNVFQALRAWLIKKGFSYRQCFWVTGTLAFFISPIADNLTTALLMCAVVIAVGSKSPKFVLLSCINIVVAANAGGAFSPFGDITTLMVWQNGILQFEDFFVLFVPAAINFLIPAAIMTFSIPNEKPPATSAKIELKVGAKRTIVLFLLTIITAVIFENFLHLPATMGMLTGLGYLMVASFFIKKYEQKKYSKEITAGKFTAFNIFNKISRAEWDTLFFFYGVILSVGGLAVLGYLEFISHIMYDDWGQYMPDGHKATVANVAIGIMSAIIDNIPVMFAVLTMKPGMSEGQWLLVTLTAGVGGSLLSIGSAAGVALMGQAKGIYTFMSHLRWSWAILLGYIGSILAHIWINNNLF
jgi:Na+/H+ antiporter NhaD/arsenite permease-like protein